ncbi:MAG: amidohydrolase family protein [Armatimonadota bacterium]|nr:amidohydrolase family protein [Armatimonadota bacterium]MDR7511051.1 amidohydrolase family protein [Armatimonadota bacterium]
MTRLPVPVLDAHAHFPVRRAGGDDPARTAYVGRFGRQKWELIQRHLAADQEAWRRAWGFPAPEPPGEDAEMAARWAHEVERHGLVRVVFLTGGGNDRLAAAVRAHPGKFIGFAHHDPFVPGAAAELERAVTELGLSGYKIVAPHHREPLNDERLYPLWETAERLGVPVLIHFGPLRYEGVVAGPNISPLVLQDVARAFPGVPFIVPHFGCGYPRELLHLMWVCGNVYVDTSGSNEWIRWMPYELTIKSLFRKFLETAGPQRVLFGTDSSWFPRGFAHTYLEVQFRACQEIGVPEADLRLIFAGNAARLLGVAVPGDDVA